ncbi:MAG: hypothetical protein CM15mP93_17170 [Thiotrichaceae bacterium]|nr:MAG: hypothetical protein CM15mP93_17170 [Thiotrichaceae bacterium]
MSLGESKETQVMFAFASNSKSNGGRPIKPVPPVTKTFTIKKSSFFHTYRLK